MKGSSDAHVKAQESPYMREETGKGTIINDVCKITGILDPSPLICPYLLIYCTEFTSPTLQETSISFWPTLNIAPKRGFTLGFTKLSIPLHSFKFPSLPPPHKMTSRLPDSSHLSPSRMHLKLNILSTGTFTAVGDKVMSPCQCNPLHWKHATDHCSKPFRLLQSNSNEADP